MFPIRLQAGEKALRFSNVGSPWCAQLWLSSSSFDPHATYRLRARVKVCKKALQQTDAEAFNIGVYDVSESKTRLCCSRKASALQDGEWSWVDCGMWIPDDGQYIWVSSGAYDAKHFPANPSVENLYLDQIEILLVGGSASSETSEECRESKKKRSDTQ